MPELSFGTYAPGQAKNLLLAIIQNSKLKRGAFRPLMSRLIGPDPVDTIYQGGRFRFHHRDSATEMGALFNPLYNIEELDFLRRRLAPASIFIDVGANVGTFSIPIACHIGKEGRVIAIEPHPTAFSRLMFNCGEHELGNITPVNYAASDKSGALKLSTDSSNLGACRVSDDGIEVKARTLLDIVTEHNIYHIDAMKIDIEGFEDKALLPFFRSAQRSLWPRAVAIEHLERTNWTNDCIMEMTDFGYREIGKTRSNTFLDLV